LTIVGTAIILLPFLTSTLHGIKIYLRSPFITLHSPSVLEGMRVTPDEAAVYSSVQDHLRTYFSLYPNAYGMNLSPDDLYMLMDPHMQQFHRQTMYWDWATEAVFPEYLPIVREKIKKDRPAFFVRDPVIFSLKEDPSVFQNYCQIDLASRGAMRIQMLMRPLFLRFPAEHIASISWDGARVHMQPLLGTVKLLALSYTPIKKEETPLNVDIAQGANRVFPYTAQQEKSIYVDFTSSFAGHCQVKVPQPSR